MKGSRLLFFFMLIVPALSYAGETKILFDQYKIAGPQVSKDYYIKESVRRVDPKNPYILEVRTYRKVTSPDGATTYRVTRQINCKKRESTIVKYWSSGFGDDDGTMVDGKWRPFKYKDTIALADMICPK